MHLTRVMALATKAWREMWRDRIFSVLAFLLPVILIMESIQQAADPSETPSFGVYYKERGACDRSLWC